MHSKQIRNYRKFTDQLETINNDANNKSFINNINYANASLAHNEAFAL